MSRRAVEVEIILLDVLAVIALAVGQAEQPLLQDRVLAVPQGNAKAQPLVVVAEPRQAVLTPMIGPRAGLIVGEIVPRIAVLAVVLANRAPLTLAEVRPPLLPRHPVLARLVEAHLFRRLDWFGVGFLRQSLLLCDKLCCRLYGLCGGMIRDRGSPRLQEGEHDRDQGRPDEEAQEAERDKAAKDTQNGQRQRHRDAKSDEPGFDEIVDRADEHAPDDHEHAPDLLILREEPPGRSTPDQREQRATDLADREQQANEAERPGARDSSDGQADGEQDGLDSCCADYAVSDSAYRAGRDVERLLGDRTPKAPERIVQHRNEPIAIGPEHRRHD